MFELWQPGWLQLKAVSRKNHHKKEYPPFIPSLQMRWDFFMDQWNGQSKSLALHGLKSFSVKIRQIGPDNKWIWEFVLSIHIIQSIEFAVPGGCRSEFALRIEGIYLYQLPQVSLYRNV
jgi:hypothetical protein